MLNITIACRRLDFRHRGAADAMIVGVHNFAKGSARRSAKAAARRIIWRAEIGCGTRRSIMVLVEQGGEVTGINIAIRKTAD